MGYRLISSRLINRNSLNGMPVSFLKSIVEVVAAAKYALVEAIAAPLIPSIGMSKKFNVTVVIAATAAV